VPNTGAFYTVFSYWHPSRNKLTISFQILCGTEVSFMHSHWLVQDSQKQGTAFPALMCQWV